MYVIWSFEHGQWWGQNHHGYVSDLADAGEYDEVEAGLIVCRSIFLDEVAIHCSIAKERGAPRFHAYRGEVQA